MRLHRVPHLRVRLVPLFVVVDSSLDDVLWWDGLSAGGRGVFKFSQSHSTRCKTSTRLNARSGFIVVNPDPLEGWRLGREGLRSRGGSRGREHTKLRVSGVVELTRSRRPSPVFGKPSSVRPRGEGPVRPRRGPRTVSSSAGWPSGPHPPWGSSIRVSSVPGSLVEERGSLTVEDTHRARSREYLCMVTRQKKRK